MKQSSIEALLKPLVERIEALEAILKPTIAPESLVKVLPGPDTITITSVQITAETQSDVS